MFGKVTYSYTPEDWSQERFLALGGFTVVFLNYNKAAFIEKSVASVLNQDFERLEMFFMDDASTDGSGDTMEKLVRGYRGRHKVTVVRNTENQHITGQWNIVSKLATGNWYGMFCGDDIAHPNRATIAAEVLKETPTLLGFCTNAVEVGNAPDGISNVCVAGIEEELAVNGKVSAKDLLGRASRTVGASAWYHRSVFEKQLPKGPLDDVIIRWILQSKGFGCEDPIWRFVATRNTVSYSMGSGISTEMMVSGSGALNSELWRNGVLARRKFFRLMNASYAGVAEYFKTNGCSVELRRAIRLALLKSDIIRHGTWARIFVDLPRVLIYPMLLDHFAKFFIREFLGVYISSFVFTKLRRRG